MATRKRLPADRNSITHRVEIQDERGGVCDVYMTVGLYPLKAKEKPGELFLKSGKMGSAMRGMLDIVGLQASLLMQYGVPLQVICDKMKGVGFEPCGKTDDPDIPECKSVPDYVFRWMEKRFLERTNGRSYDTKISKEILEDK